MVSRSKEIHVTWLLFVHVEVRELVCSWLVGLGLFVSWCSAERVGLRRGGLWLLPGSPQLVLLRTLSRVAGLASWVVRITQTALFLCENKPFSCGKPIPAFLLHFETIGRNRILSVLEQEFIALTRDLLERVIAGLAGCRLVSLQVPDSFRKSYLLLFLVMLSLFPLLLLRFHRPVVHRFLQRRQQLCIIIAKVVGRKTWQVLVTFIRL